MSAKAKAPETKKVRRVPLPPSVVGLLNRLQVCDALGGISVRNLTEMISEGRFPPADARLGRLPRWSVPLVNAWCASQVSGRVAPPGRED